MNAIESIKEQVSAVVVFTAITLDECYDQDEALCDRIAEALDRMEKSKVFTKAEIDDVRKYAHNTRYTRYNECKCDIIAKARADFKF